MDNKHYLPDQIYSMITESGYKKATTPLKKQIIKGIIAGMCIALAAASTCVAIHSIEDYGVAKLVAGVTFPVGLMLIIFSGAELFTSDCLIALNLKDNKVKLWHFVKTLFVVFFSNFIGAAFIAYLFYSSGQLGMSYNGLAQFSINIANSKLNLDFYQAFTSGIICNILVCLAVIAFTAAKDVTGKIWATFFPIMAFAITGVEHCVANMYYLSVAFLASLNPVYAEGIDVSNITISNIFVNNLLPVTLGNIVGGLLMGVLMYFSMRNASSINTISSIK